MSHFAVGHAIRDHLAAGMPELRQVRLAASMAEIAEWQPSSPAAWVIWQGDRIADGDARGRAQIVQQDWIVAIIVRSVRDASSGGGVVEEAGPLYARMITLLMGWQPDQPIGCRPLARIDAPAPGYGAGYGYFPAAFRAAIPMTGIGD